MIGERNVLGKSAILYGLRKTLATFAVFFIATSLVFFLFRLLPGNPILAYVMAMQQQYSYLSPEMLAVIEQYRKAFNLEGDIFSQYINFLKELYLYGNLGPSFLNFPKPAQQLILEAIPWTIGLLGLSVVIAWVFGLITGGLIGWFRDKKISNVLYLFSVFLSQIPSYFMAILLVLIFGYILALLPYQGAYSPALKPGFTFDFLVSVIRHGTLPALSIIITSLFGWILSARSLIISILGEDYLSFAEAKGLNKSRIFKRYVMRNALLPQITALGITLGFTVSGSIVIETIFVYPGIGRLYSLALQYRDYNVIMGCVILTTGMVLFANLILELLYPVVDPRIELG